MMFIHYFSQSYYKILVIKKENSILISMSLLGSMTTFSLVHGPLNNSNGCCNHTDRCYIFERIGKRSKRILILWKWNDQHVTSVGRRENLSPPQDSNLWPPKHRADALSTWATYGELMESEAIDSTRFIFDKRPACRQAVQTDAHFFQMDRQTIQTIRWLTASNDFLKAFNRITNG